MNITIHKDGRNYGPYSLEEVRQHLASGSLALTDLAFTEGASEWTTLNLIPGVATSLPPPARLVKASPAPAQTIVIPQSQQSGDSMGCGSVLLCIIFPPLAVVGKGCGAILIVSILTAFGWVPGTIAAIIFLSRDAPNQTTVVIHQGESFNPNTILTLRKKTNPLLRIILAVFVLGLLGLILLSIIVGMSKP